MMMRPGGGSPMMHQDSGMPGMPMMLHEGPMPVHEERLMPHREGESMPLPGDGLPHREGDVWR